MKKYYEISENAWGDYPQNLNLNRHTCDTFFVVEDGKLVDGFIYSKYIHSDKPPGFDEKKFIENYAVEKNEIDKEYYLECRDERFSF